MQPICLQKRAQARSSMISLPDRPAPMPSALKPSHSTRPSSAPASDWTSEVPGNAPARLASGHFSEDGEIVCIGGRLASGGRERCRALGGHCAELLLAVHAVLLRGPRPAGGAPGRDGPPPGAPLFFRSCT